MRARNRFKPDPTEESRLGFLLGGFAAIMAIIALPLIFSRRRNSESP